MNNQIKNIITPTIISLFIVILNLNKNILKFLQFDRISILNGEVWRLFTGHFVHWSYEHLFWDILTFYILSLIFYRIGKCSFWTLVLFSPIVISIMVWFIFPEMSFYRGLSGVDVALYANASIYFLNKLFKDKNLFYGIFGVFTFTLMVSKILYEIFLSANVFVNSDNFIPLPMTHFAGAIIGMIIYFTFHLLKRYHFFDNRKVCCR